MISANSSVPEIAFIVCTAMSKAGSTVVLSGGGAATVYAPEAHQTDDLDFILQFGAAAVNVSPILALGYESRSSRSIYSHPDSPYTIEFINGPLAVGSEIVRAWDTLRDGDLLLHVITATDCVKDRLAAAIHWNDLSSAAQAAAVARLHPVDIEGIKAWAQKEGGSDMLDVFRKLLEIE